VTTVASISKAPHVAAQPTCSQNVLGVELHASGQASYGGKCYGDGEGFVLRVGNGVRAGKLPRANVVYFALTAGIILMMVFCKRSRRWTSHFAVVQKRLPNPFARLYCFVEETLRRQHTQAAWLPLPFGAFPLSDSLSFHAGGFLEFETPGGKSCRKRLGEIDLVPLEVVLGGMRGRWQLRRVGSHRIELSCIDTNYCERIKYDPQEDCFYRYAVSRQFAFGEMDRHGIQYLQEKTILFADAPIAFKQLADGKPWRIELEDGTEISHQHAGWLLVEDCNHQVKERCLLRGRWAELDVGRREISAPWILNGESQLSVKVLDVVELFADGDLSFLNHRQFSIEEEIDVCGPAGLRLVRSAGSRWFYLYENDELLGAGVYSVTAFRDRDGKWHPGWGFGQETLPTGRDNRLEFLMPWGVLLSPVLIYLFPTGMACLMAATVAICFGIPLLLLFGSILFDFFRPVHATLREPLWRLFRTLIH